MMRRLVAGIIALTLIPVVAQGQAPDSGGGRYVIEKQGDGLVRLDTQTGAVSLCRQKPVGMVCETAADDRRLLEDEIARLRSENGALKQVLLSHGLPLPPGSRPEQPAPQNGASAMPELRLPNDADLRRMVALAGRVWHRLVEAVERAQQQIMNKG